MRPKINFKVINGVTIKIDGIHCNKKCEYRDSQYSWCNLFVHSGLYRDIEDNGKFIRCRQCVRYTNANS